MHRGRKRAVVIGVACFLLSGCWPQPGWGPGRTGHNPFEGDLNAENVNSLTEAWSVDLGDEPVTDPAISGHGVHTVAGRTLHTRSLGDGTTRWSAPVLPADDEWPQEVGSPSQHGDDVIVPVWVHRDSQASTGTRAYDAASGAGGAVIAPQALDAVTVDGELLASRSAGYAHDLWVATLDVTDLADAEKSWRTIVKFDNFAHETTTVAVGGNRLVLGLDSSVVAFTRTKPAECEPPDSELQVCTPAWTRVLSGTATLPVISGATVYVGDAGGTLWALDAGTGSVRWRANVGRGVHAVNAPPTVGDGRLYVTTSDGVLHAFAADGCGAPTCTASWVGATGSPINEQAALAGGVVYIGSANGSLDAFAAAGCGAVLCAPLWEASTGSAITGAPAVGLGRLVVGTADGRLISFAAAPT